MELVTLEVLFMIFFNCEDKLKFFLLTGQLSKEQINAISEIGVSTIPEL